MTFVQARFVLGTFVHIRNISAVNDSICTNFKGRFLEHGDICPYQQNLSCHWSDFDQTLKVVFLGQSLIDANFQGDISPYQQYLSYYCPDFDKNFWTEFFGGLIFVHHIFLDQTSFDPKFFQPKIFSDPKFFPTQNIFQPKIFSYTKFFCDPGLSKLNTFDLGLVSQY